MYCVGKRGLEKRMKTSELRVELDAERLDRHLSERLRDLSRAQVQRLIRQGWVLVNGAVPKSGDKVRIGDKIVVTWPQPAPSHLEPQAIPLNIVFQDQDMVVLDKPAGLTVHPSPGHPSHTLVNALLALYPDLPGIGGEQRPGIVHRLDKDTSGLMMVAKTSKALQVLSSQIKCRSVRKGYLALVIGEVAEQRGVIEAAIARDPKHRKRMAVVEGGREAKTRYSVLRALGAFTLLKIFTESGRTHQIRVHFASIGHPLVGDSLYGGKSCLISRQFLHAHILGFNHPVSGKYLEFVSPLPSDLAALLEALKQGGRRDMVDIGTAQSISRSDVL